MEIVKCGLAPDGWSCKREAGHDGPCAAEQILNPVAALRMLLRQPITGDYYELRIGKEFRNALLAEIDRHATPRGVPAWALS